MATVDPEYKISLLEIKLLRPNSTALQKSQPCPLFQTQPKKKNFHKSPNSKLGEPFTRYSSGLGTHKCKAPSNTLYCPVVIQNLPPVLWFENDVSKVSTRNTILKLQIDRNLSRHRFSHCPGIRDDNQSNREQIIYISAHKSIKSSLDACPSRILAMNVKLSRAICCRKGSPDVNSLKAASIFFRWPIRIANCVAGKKKVFRAFIRQQTGQCRNQDLLANSARSAES
ncbi:hypothetical protein CDAR_553831 [Caerostris darwini]|uniref:Uncharacterized protein n=1 Tax=Caerostris darwini TaxID=1538125 RepID=A0AAV4WKE6_9ARAC|nr:hypothetical protein CDAR_553831 [Caerostris darwini]